MRFSLAAVAAVALFFSASATPVGSMVRARDGEDSLSARSSSSIGASRAALADPRSMFWSEWTPKKRDDSDDSDDKDSDESDEDSSDDKDDEDSDENSSDDEESDDKDDESSDDSSDEKDKEKSGDDKSSDDEDDSSDSGSGSGSVPSNSTTPSVPSTPSTPSTGGGGGGSGSGAKASATFPKAAGESTLSKPMTVTGEFDGGMVRFGRGVSCTSGEGGGKDAVFMVEDGGTLKNVIIGADQIEGVHCAGACTIENVWWEAVCEDALSFKGDGDGTVIGGGAKGAKDKVVQHNGVGTISISGFYATDFGKLYRSCGNCDSMGERHVIVDGVIAEGGSSTLVGINSNYGDTATITNSCVTDTKVVCQEFKGNDSGDEPEKISEGPSSACIFTDADVNVC